jgi:hypothetical protein
LGGVNIGKYLKSEVNKPYPINLNTVTQKYAIFPSLAGERLSKLLPLSFQLSGVKTPPKNTLPGGGAPGLEPK